MRACVSCDWARVQALIPPRAPRRGYPPGGGLPVMCDIAGISSDATERTMPGAQGNKGQRGDCKFVWNFVKVIDAEKTKAGHETA